MSGQSWHFRMDNEPPNSASLIWHHKQLYKDTDHIQHTKKIQDNTSLQSTWCKSYGKWLNSNCMWIWNNKAKSVMTLQSLQIWAQHGIPNEASPRSDQVDYPNLKRAIDEIDLRQQRQKTLLLAHPRKKKKQILQGNLSTPQRSTWGRRSRIDTVGDGCRIVFGNDALAKGATKHQLIKLIQQRIEKLRCSQHVK